MDKSSKRSLLYLLLMFVSAGFLFYIQGNKNVNQLWMIPVFAGLMFAIYKASLFTGEKPSEDSNPEQKNEK
ncbi:MAG: hypothetical protein CO119_09955 [Flavobacteriales bacterium CG_4_9_14_3_um_filter_40_17]|nr:MAG: hypothetical protein CO119_09955 [Flavobacteriales bacterium CG_4_9_14_3_um_filter_40_17]